MAIPPFTANGDLPVGVHKATLKEVGECFGQDSLQRRNVFRRLERIFEVANGTGHLGRFVVFGSFVTAKDDPNDVDIFIIMDDGFDISRVAGEAAIVFDHQECDSHFGASVFWVRRLGAIGGEQAAVEYWQTTREQGKRGIVEITGDQ